MGFRDSKCCKSDYDRERGRYKATQDYNMPHTASHFLQAFLTSFMIICCFVWNGFAQFEVIHVRKHLLFRLDHFFVLFRELFLEEKSNSFLHIGSLSVACGKK